MIMSINIGKRGFPYHLTGNLVYVFNMDNLEDQNKIRIGNGVDAMALLCRSELAEIIRHESTGTTGIQ